MVLKRKLDHAKRKRIGGVQYSGDQSIVLGWLNTVDRRVYDIRTISQETGLRLNRVEKAVGDLRRRSVRSPDMADHMRPLMDIDDTQPKNEAGEHPKLSMRSVLLRGDPAKLAPKIPDARDDEIAKLRAQLAELGAKQPAPKEDGPKDPGAPPPAGPSPSSSSAPRRNNQG